MLLTFTFVNDRKTVGIGAKAGTASMTISEKAMRIWHLMSQGSTLPELRSKTMRFLCTVNYFEADEIMNGLLEIACHLTQMLQQILRITMLLLGLTVIFCHGV